MTKILFLIVLYSVIFVFLWGASGFFLYMESLGRHMIDNGFVIKKGYLSRDRPDNRLVGRLHRYYYRRGKLDSDHPDRDTPVGKLYSYYYFCIAVGGRWIIWGLIIFVALLLCAQIISLVTTGQYFRGNPLFAKMLAL